MAPTLSVEQLRCSICFEVFTNPTSIPCGHNFCLQCINRSWNIRHKYSCPLCIESFKPRPDLKINIVLKEICEEFKRSQKYKPLPKRPVSPVSLSQVPCDTCHGTKAPAVKSCLVCNRSYCEAHLTPHLRDPVLTMHRLTDPGTFSHLCRSHKKTLSKFCKDDQKPVCSKCTERDHKNHTIIPIEKEGKRIMSVIKKNELKCDQMIEVRISKRDEIKQDVEQSKLTKASMIQASAAVYTQVISAIEINQALLIEEIERQQEEAEKKAQVYLDQLEQEISELQRRRSELQQLEKMQDPLHLTQSYVPMSPRLANSDWTDMKIHNDLHLGQVREAFSKLVDTCRALEEKLYSDEVDKLSQYAVNVTFDPATAAGWLNLSPDRKKVSLHTKPRSFSLPNDPRRFDSCVSILGKQSFTSGRHYWVVQVGDKTEWDLGVARESINTKGAVTVRPDCGFWAICRRKGGSLNACAGPSVTLQLQEMPQKVGIFLDYEEGKVSFTNADAKTHIYTYAGCGFTEPLYPYFNPCLAESGKNTAPLVICPVQQHYHPAQGTPPAGRETGVSFL